MGERLDDQQYTVLAALKAAGRVTASELAARNALSAVAVEKTLRDLEAREPPVVRRDVDASLGQEVWIATEAAVAALGD